MTYSPSAAVADEADDRAPDSMVHCGGFALDAAGPEAARPAVGGGQTEILAELLDVADIQVADGGYEGVVVEEASR